ncbi:hypothetical protein ACA910_008237 [Epithemia clementina (nom. ined.)]
MTAASNDAGCLAVANAIGIAFFFLLRPGEYTGTTTDNTPFRLADIQVAIGSRHLPWHTALTANLLAATSVSYTFTSQKNGVHGEVINHSCSGHA